MSTRIGRIDAIDVDITSNEGVTVAMSCISGPNWSLANLYSEADAEEKAPLCRRLGDYLSDMGAKRIYAPTPVEFNAKVIKPEVLNVAIPLGKDITMYRNKNDPADGTFLSTVGDGAIFSVAGCPTIVAMYGNMVTTNHAGRDCLIDRKWIDTNFNEKGRPNDSVVDSIVRAFQDACREAGTVFRSRDIQAWVFWSIQPHDFLDDLNHERWAARNQKTMKYVMDNFGSEAIYRAGDKFGYDLPVIIREQFAAYGVNVNINNAYLPEGFHTTRNNTEGLRCLMAAVRKT